MLRGLRRLELISYTWADATLAALPVGSLVDLSLDAAGLGQAGLVSLARLAPRLKRLKLNNRGEQPEDLDLGALSALTSLEALDLDLEDCASIVAWFSSRPPRSLKCLSLTGFEDWNLLLSVLPRVPELTGLSLCVNVFEGSGLEKVHMLAINKAQKLETLCLRNFSSDGLQHLRLPALRSLHLLDWSDDELDLSGCAGLEHVLLEYCPRLHSFRHMPKLVRLNLTCCCLLLTAELMTIPGLHACTVAKCERVDREQLRSAFPGAKIAFL